MPKLVLDDIEFNSEDLSETGQIQLKSLQYTEQQLIYLQKDIDILQTAKKAYLSELKSELETLKQKDINNP
jgi:hypothetical protein